MTLLNPSALLLVGLVIPEFILFLRFSRARKMTVPSIYLWKRLKPGRPRLGWRKISRILEFLLLACGTALLGIGLAMPVPDGETRPVAVFVACAPETHDAKILGDLKAELRRRVQNVARHRSVAVILPDGSAIGPSESRNDILSAINNFGAIHKSRSMRNVYSIAAKFGEPVEAGILGTTNSYGILGVDIVAGKLAAIVYNYKETQLSVKLVFQSETGSVSVENRRLDPRLNVIEVPEVDIAKRWILSLVPPDSYSADDKYYIQPIAPEESKIFLILKKESVEFIKSALDAIKRAGMPLSPGGVFSYTIEEEAGTYVSNTDFTDSIIITDLESLDRFKTGSRIVWLKNKGIGELRLTTQDKIRISGSYIHTAYAGSMGAVASVETIASVRDTPVAGLSISDGKIIAIFGFNPASHSFLISPAFPILMNEVLLKIRQWEPVEAPSVCGEPFRAKPGLKFDYARMIAPATGNLRIVDGTVLTPNMPGIYELSVSGFKVTRCVNVCSHPEARPSTVGTQETGIQIYDMCAFAGISLLGLEVIVFLFRCLIRINS